MLLMQSYAVCHCAARRYAVNPDQRSFGVLHQAGEWTVGVLPGPNEAPDYFTPDDIKTLYSSPYSVHYNS
jgi:hypothetical protein